MPDFTFIDLFAGMGGFHVALAELGGRCVLASEIDAGCQATYSANHPATPLVGDIRELTRDAAGRELSPAEIRQAVPEHDVLCAGFPCQPFSKSGRQLGFRDETRGTLFFDILLVLEARRPPFILLENVRNLAGRRHTHTWNTIIYSLRDAGYHVNREPLLLSPHMLPPALGGTAQLRERVFILGWRKDVAGPAALDHLLAAVTPKERPTWSIEEFLLPDHQIDDPAQYRLRPEEEAWVEAWAALLHELPDDDLPATGPIWVRGFNSNYYVAPDEPPWNRRFISQSRSLYLRNVDLVERWLRTRWGKLGHRPDQFPPSRQKLEWQAKRYQPTSASRDLSKLLMQMRPSGMRVKAPTYVPAFVAMSHTQTPVVIGRKRRLAVEEAAILQGFDPGVFRAVELPLASRMAQIGNAVHPGVVHHLAMHLFKAASGELPRSPVELSWDELGENVA